MCQVSIVIPIHDEAESIPALAAEVSAVFASLDRSWECIWIDDASRDASRAEIERVARGEPRHRLVALRTRAGQSAALHAGFRAARGAVIATLDGDGQNDPADLPRLLERLDEAGADMVNGYRERRRDSFLRRLSSRIGNGARNAITGRTVRDVGCSTRVFRRECVRDLPRFRAFHRFLPTLVTLAGFRIEEAPVSHRPRRSGRTKYGIHNRLWVGLLDLAGVWWLRRRAFRYEVVARREAMSSAAVDHSLRPARLEEVPAES